MNGPFFRNYSRSVPVQQTPQQKPSPKVISIPVHFVSSDQPPTTISMLKDSAALNIQKAFRGFTVRKSVKKIASIRNDVSKIERKITDTEVVNLIHRDAKERLRVNETLMSLLFKLDSIRGVDSGIRELRKAVTKKAIALQEKVDSIAQIDHQTLGSDSPVEIEVTENVCTTSTSEQVTETSNAVDEVVDNHNVNSEAIVDEVVKDCNIEKAEGVSGEAEAMETSPAGEKDDNEKGERAILEDLMEDNEKLKRLMVQISERNEMQTRMINSLSRRVEQLERNAEKQRKKKTHVPLRRKRDVDSFCI